MIKGLFAAKPVFRKFLITGFTVALCTLVFSMVAGLLTGALYGVDPLRDSAAFSDPDAPGVIQAMRLFQLLSTGIGMFLVPVLLLALVFSNRPMHYLRLDRRVSLSAAFCTIALMFLAVPLVNLLLNWNEHMQLPSFLSGVEQWMKHSEEQLAQLTDAFMRMENFGDVVSNLLVVAVLPAIGEELLFRGVLQRLFTELTKNTHVAIFITAAVFSAIHMQFYGFLPRMALGMLFGYMLLWTGSMWIPILAHLFNNGAAVVLAYISTRYGLPFNQDTVGAEPGDWKWVVICLAVAMAIIYYMRTLGRSTPVGGFPEQEA